MARLEYILHDTVFAMALVAPVVAVALFVLSLRRRSRTRRRIAWCAAFLVATVAVNPIAQFFFLEPFDAHRGHVLASEASNSGLVGMNAEQARAMLGTPDSVHHFESGTTLWAYKQVPGYWLGSSFQVFFRDNAVTGFEANDD